MNKFLLFIFSSLLLGLSSCGEGKNIAEGEEVESPQIAEGETVEASQIIYERTACYGLCPQFELKIEESGKAFYNGINHVDLIGLYQATMPQSTMQSIIAHAKSIGFFEMEMVYDDPNVMDLPSIELYISEREGKNKLVKNRYQGPKKLHELYRILDDWIESTEWKPIEN